jgi:MFS transporter, DHA2 family, multidrug resistance protein
MFSLMRNIGSSIGISVMITLLTQNTQIIHASLAEHLTPFRHAMQQPWLPSAWDWHTAAGAAALNEEVTAQAATIGYLNDFTAMMWIVIAVIPLLLLMEGPRRGGTREPLGVME